MPPLPKRKTSKARQRKRRSHLSISGPSTEACPRCHELKLAHTLCPTCGTYKGQEVIEVKGKKK